MISRFAKVLEELSEFEVDIPKAGTFMAQFIGSGIAENYLKLSILNSETLKEEYNPKKYLKLITDVLHSLSDLV